jgi:hypothetical protein
MPDKEFEKANYKGPSKLKAPSGSKSFRKEFSKTLNISSGSKKNQDGLGDKEIYKSGIFSSSKKITKRSRR